MRVLTAFSTLRALSFANSAVFTALLVCAFALNGPEPATAALGWTHGGMWIVLSALSLVAVRRGTMPFWLAVLVAIVGGLGPFVGSAGFLEAKRRGFQPRERRVSKRTGGRLKPG